MLESQKTCLLIPLLLSSVRSYTYTPLDANGISITIPDFMQTPKSKFPPKKNGYMSHPILKNPGQIRLKSHRSKKSVNGFDTKVANLVN